MPKSPIAVDATPTDAEILTARAERAQKAMRKDAPGKITVGEIFDNPRQTQVYRLVPEAFGMSRNPTGRKFKIHGGEGATMSTLYDSPERVKTVHADNGWTVVLEDDGSIAQHGGDWLMKRPIEFSQRDRDRDQAESDLRLRSQDKEDSDNALMSAFRDVKKKSSDGEQLTVSNVDTSQEGQ